MSSPVSIGGLVNLCQAALREDITEDEVVGLVPQLIGIIQQLNANMTPFLELENQLGTLKERFSKLAQDSVTKEQYNKVIEESNQLKLEMQKLRKMMFAGAIPPPPPTPAPVKQPIPPTPVPAPTNPPAPKQSILTPSPKTPSVRNSVVPLVNTTIEAVKKRGSTSKGSAEGSNKRTRREDELTSIRTKTKKVASQLQDKPLKFKESDKLTDAQKKQVAEQVLQLSTKQPHTTHNEIHERHGLAKPQVYAIFQILKRQGKVEKEGNTSGAIWKFIQ